MIDICDGRVVIVKPKKKLFAGYMSHPGSDKEWVLSLWTTRRGLYLTRTDNVQHNEEVMFAPVYKRRGHCFLVPTKYSAEYENVPTKDGMVSKVQVAKDSETELFGVTFASASDG